MLALTAGTREIMSQTTESAAAPARDDWSNRLLSAALAGILFLTLYPFEFLPHPKGIGHASPLLLGHGAKASGVRDVVLNVLLFVPFGFALGSKLRKQGRSWPKALLYTWLIGILLSYGIELVQLYVPERDSGWGDVVTNSTGSAMGCAIAIFFGRWVFTAFADLGRSLAAHLTLRRAGSLLLIYFTAWFLASVSLQKETHLEDWASDCRLVIGNDASGWHPWKGQVSLLEIWDRALPGSVAGALTRGGQVPAAMAPVIKLAFPAVVPGRGNVQPGSSPLSLGGPALETILPRDVSENISPSETSAPAADLVNALKRANQFSILLVLKPPEVGNPNGSIVSISHTSGLRDLYLRQEESSLILWFRSPLSLRRALDWSIPRLLATDGFHDVLISYDGSEIWLYADGRKPRHEAMGPGAALASHVRHVKESELNGYGYIYYAIVFLPAGMLLGIISQGQFWRRLPSLTTLVAVLLVAPAVLEWFLLRTNQRHFSLSNFVLSSAMVVLGLLWMSCDRRQMAVGAGKG
jgi:VanZ family protein